jgi:deazaflavin-dependent oxidoreductase (nitroreductase family)
MPHARGARSRYAFRVPFPHWLARLNKAGLNRVTRHVAPRAPGFGLVVHRGRRSGRVYRTPVNVFPAGDGFVFALTYGRDKTDWVKNVLAAGGCEVHARGRVYQVESPRLYHDETRHGIPLAQRQVLRLLGVADFLSVKIVR